MRAREFGELLLFGIVPIALYLPLLEVSVRLQRRSPGMEALAEPMWLALWLGTTAIGYVLVARRVPRYRVLIGIFYVPAMMIALVYFGLVLGIYLDGEGP